MSKTTRIEKVFNVVSKYENWSPNYNLGAAQRSPIICSDDPGILVDGRFGYRPSYKPQSILLNARSEKLTTSLEWKKALATNRCLVPAEAFYEGPAKEKLSKPFLVYLRETPRPFAFAGIYRDQEVNGELLRTFAILTTSPSPVLRTIGHPRSPVILDARHYRQWLDNGNSMSSYTDAIGSNINFKMNAYPVSPDMRSGKLNEKGLVDPIGQRVISEYDYQTKTGTVVVGMGNRRKGRQYGFDDDIQK